MQILLVDDDEDGRRYLTYWLKKFGYEVLACGDGKSALALLSQRSVDLIIVDVYMPEMSGLDLLIQIQKRWPGCTPRSILISAHSDSVTLTAVEDTRADYFLSKPLDMNRLFGILDENNGIAR